MTTLKTITSIIFFLSILPTGIVIGWFSLFLIVIFFSWFASGGIMDIFQEDMIPVYSRAFLVIVIFIVSGSVSGKLNQLNPFPKSGGKSK